jgi:pyrimidine-specific ribonucleoside hydrolase
MKPARKPTFDSYLIFCFVFLLATAIMNFSADAQQRPVKVIFDTDMGPDYDDVGAITLLHAFAAQGEAEILATMASTKYEGVASVLSVLNTFFQKPGIQIAVPRGKAVELKDFQHWTDTLIRTYPHDVKKNSEVSDAVSLYRQILASQPDNSVTIITVGFLTNIADLLQSQPDRYSKLNGRELVAKKVSRMVSMAGKFPAGLEFNIEEDAASAVYAFTHFPRPILFSGFEIGEKIKTGLPLIKNLKIKNNPVKDVYRICIAMTPEDAQGRMSWDQTAVLVAIEGHKEWYDLREGRIVLDSKGNNTWDPTQKGHAYLVAKTGPEVVTNIIDNLMMYQPNH